MENTIKRRKSRKVFVGDVAIGGDSPISVQSMLNVKTTDVEGCIKQINALRCAGCDLIRLAVPDEGSAYAFKIIAQRTGLPLIADVHYSYKLAHLALDCGAKKLRMNPGNMTDFSQIEGLAKRLVDLNVPVRVGVNGGSLAPEYEGMNEVDALVESALDCADKFEKYGMSNIVIAIKHSDTMTNIQANRKLAAVCDYPLHIGVTEAGTLRTGLIKSAIGIATLLEEGIGDTLRASLSADVVEEAFAGRKILQTLGLRRGVDVVACPTCARTQIDVAGLAQKIEDLTSNVDVPLRISVLGCPLNGIGEGKGSDVGVAGGKERSVLLKDGEIVATVKNEDLINELEKLINEKIKQKQF